MADGSGNGYVRTVRDYVHLSPVRATARPGAEANSDQKVSQRNKRNRRIGTVEPTRSPE